MRTLRGPGITLEPQLAAHAAELYPILKDPALYEFIDAKEPASEEALRVRYDKLETRLSGDGTEDWLNWIVRTDAGVVVGYVQATVYPSHEAEIAYVLGRAFWRKGHGRAACVAMMDELRDAYNVVRFTATLDPANAASVGLLKSLGFGFVSEDREAQEVIYARPSDP